MVLLFSLVAENIPVFLTIGPFWVILLYFNILVIDGDVRIFYFFLVKMTPWYVLSTLLCKNAKCLNMYLITLKVFKICVQN
jgi:hypothetical protein